MIHLADFTEADFELLISVIESEKDLIQFAGPVFQYPLSKTQLENYLSDKNRSAYKILLDHENIGHCEIYQNDAIPRLCRIIIHRKDLRNKGLGKLIVNNLLSICFEERSYEKVDLNVFEWNRNAIFCYQKVGFIINPDKSYEMIVNGEPWKAVNMVINKEDWKAESKNNKL